MRSVSERLATGLALLFALGLLAWAIWREDRAPETAPQEVVWRMLEASRTGDAAGYLACFGGELEQRLRAMATELGEEGFSRYLERSVGELEGVGLFDLARRGERAELVVEYVYALESERQSLELEREGSDWKITGATASTRRRSLIPHGTPIEEVD